MRHLRMVGLGLLAVLVVSATATATASAKDPWSVNTWGQYKYCPYNNPEVNVCVAGVTAGGSKGGFFEYGKVKVKLNKSIVLQGAASNYGTETQFYSAVNGGETLEAPELKVTGGIGLFNKAVQQETEWPAALTASWKEAKKAKETAVNVKIELAGNECVEVLGCLNINAIVAQEGVAFRLPLKVKVTGPWLEKLGGGPCYIGSDENPIHINLTTGGAGAHGKAQFNEEFTQINLSDSRLVDVGWKIEPASAPKGCGGAYESYVDASLANVLEMEAQSSGSPRTGVVILQGNLHDASRLGVLEEGFASGELP